MLGVYYQDGSAIHLGDWVRVYVPALGVWHHGIIQCIYFVPNGLAVRIVHNDKANGISLIDWHEFADGNQIVLHKRPCQFHAPQVVQRAIANLGKPYHLFAKNCEHFASFAFAGEARSETVRVVSMFAGIILLAGFLGSE